jgi:glucose dehydrogenase
VRLISKTGQELWPGKLEYAATAVPITYHSKSGKQYVAIVAAGSGKGNHQALLVFSLP